MTPQQRDRTHERAHGRRGRVNTGIAGRATDTESDKENNMRAIDLVAAHTAYHLGMVLCRLGESAQRQAARWAQYGLKLVKRANG